MNPTGLCKCGCGGSTKLAVKTDPRRGQVKGEPVDYLRGHAAWRTNHGPQWIEDENGCWIWQRTFNNKGYAVGSFVTQGGEPVQLAHRFFYEKFIGPVPPGMVLDHECVNPKCVNPEHLQPVTQRANVLRQSHTKLSDADVRRAMRMHREGMTWRAVAAELGITHGPLLTRVKRLREAQPDWLRPE
jgi:hypothetical protein